MFFKLGYFFDQIIELQSFIFEMFDSTSKKLKNEGLIQINQNDGLLSPQSQMPAESISDFLKAKFQEFHLRDRRQIIKNALHNLHGRHNPIQYKESYNFKERWQELMRSSYYDTKYGIIKAQNQIPTFLQIFLLLLYTATVWFLSIYRIFNTNSLINSFICLILFTQLEDAIVKNYFIRKAISRNQYEKSRLAWKDYLRIHFYHILFLPYCIFILIENQFDFESKSLLLLVLDCIFITISFMRFDQIYEGLKIRIMASIFRNQLQVLQLLVRCIKIVHLFGIILFMVSKANEQTNWTSNITYFNEDWWSNYVYSLYFASTTLTTVGYGDITPKNKIQIGTLMFTQIFGIINFGYILTQIGRILSKMNEKDEILTKNISQAQKIAQTYTLPQILSTQMRNYIVNNQIAHDELNIEQQQNFMKKLNDQIRQDFNQFNHIRVIKSSAFFLFHWSKKFQKQVASKLVRSIYSPQQTLHQIFGKEKIYIITKGKVDVYACLIENVHSIPLRPLNVIQINPKKQIHYNVYGYSALFSGLKINLKAIVKDYTICYHLTKGDILESLIEDRRDFQYYHQIKDRIEQSYFKQIWQASSITNTREHYIPNPYYILKKNKIEEITLNKRRYCYRRVKKSQCYIQADMIKSQQQIQSQASFPDIQIQDNEHQMKDIFSLNNQLLSTRQRRVKYENIDKKKPTMIKARKYRQKISDKVKFMNEQQKERFQANQKKEDLSNQFEIAAKYEVYFPKHNLAKILQIKNIGKHSEFTTLKSEISQRLQIKSTIPQYIIERLLSAKVFINQNSEC